MSSTSIALFILIGVSLGLSGLFFYRLTQLQKKITQFTQGKDGGALEDHIAWITKKIGEQDIRFEDHQKKLTHLNKRVKTSYRASTLFHYDAYEGAAGKQSFSLALLDENQNGVIVSSITHRSQRSLYARSITQGKPDNEITEEEKRVLVETIQKL